ncbi:hypothetical protein J6590_073029 [Homalodisca vitripennis]|nr:hypothetical protein J6590_073029 [Homalodisca vitripennis]
MIVSNSKTPELSSLPVWTIEGKLQGLGEGSPELTVGKAAQIWVRTVTLCSSGGKAFFQEFHALGNRMEQLIVASAVSICSSS